jgi:integrase
MLRISIAHETRTKKGLKMNRDIGLRASEICRLKVDQVDLEGLTLTVKVKGSKYQTKVFTPETADHLRAWLDVRASIARPGVRTVFVAIRGIKPGTPMNSDGLRSVFRKMSEKAGIPLISPHVMRRTMATLAIRAGAPTRLVQVQGGWSSVRMVERYTGALRPEDFAPFSPVARIVSDWNSQ